MPTSNHQLIAIEMGPISVDKTELLVRFNRSFTTAEMNAMHHALNLHLVGSPDRIELLTKERDSWMDMAVRRETSEATAWAKYRELKAQVKPVETSHERATFIELLNLAEHFLAERQPEPEERALRKRIADALTQAPIVGTYSETKRLRAALEHLRPWRHECGLDWQERAVREIRATLDSSPLEPSPSNPAWSAAQNACDHDFVWNVLGGSYQCEKCLALSRTGTERPAVKAGLRCEWGCHVHWSGWPASHHPSCTVNGDGKQ